MEQLRGLLGSNSSLALPPAPDAISQDAQWQLAISNKLEIVLGNVAKRIRGLALLQVWRPVRHQPMFDLRQPLFADPQLLVLGQQSFAQFRLSSCQSLQFGHQGMPGRVLKSGCVQVVQNLRIIPGVLHPRSAIPDALADQVGEVVYVPVFDTTRPHAGPVAVLEALLSSRATDSMLVANFISYTGTVLAALKLSLSNPLPQPVRRSKLEGRKPRPVHPASSGDLQAAAAAGRGQPQQGPLGSTPQQPAQQQQQQPPHSAGHPACVSADAIAAAIDAAARRLCHQQQQQQQPNKPQVVPADSGSCASAAAAAASPAPAATAPAVSEACSEEQQQAVSCSAASAATAVGGATNGSAACADVVTDSNLCSTLSSRPRDAAALTAAAAACAMPPPPPAAPCSAPAATHKQLHCRARTQWEQESCDEAEGDADGCADDEVAAGCGLLLASPRPSKMQRTLSLCRTKSVSVGLDQVLDAAAQELLGGC